MRYIPKVLAALALMSAASVASAHELKYSLVLNGASEAPQNNSPGTGTGLVTVDLDLVTMRVQVTFANLTGTTTAAHIHAATALPNAGTAGVATMLPSFTNFPNGVTGATYDRTFDMTSAASYNPAYITAHGGTVSTALNDLLASFDANKAYLNIHTSAFGSGEIRGFLTAVPEPASLGACLGATLLLVSRKRR